MFASFNINYVKNFLPNHSSSLVWNGSLFSAVKRTDKRGETSIGLHLLNHIIIFDYIKHLTKIREDTICWVFEKFLNFYNIIVLTMGIATVLYMFVFTI